MTERIEMLETAVAHLSRTVEDLSEVAARHGQEIAALTRRIHLLMEREAERELGSGGAILLADQKPPHW